MGIEIERKFLVTGASWRAEVVRTEELRQGYLSSVKERVVRIRLVDGARGVLTVKGKRIADRRPEFEYEIPHADAAFMLDQLCLRPLIEKRRHRLARTPGVWTVDQFFGDNGGLVLAEVELEDGVELPNPPRWLGFEVTTDDRFANSSLQSRPYTTWAVRAPASP